MKLVLHILQNLGAYTGFIFLTGIDFLYSGLLVEKLTNPQNRNLDWPSFFLLGLVILPLNALAYWYIVRLVRKAIGRG
jgi:hypothetical protein